MPEPLAAYFDEVALHLRAVGVPSGRIEQVLAQAEERLAETGEAPEDAFGTPEEFALRLTRKRESVSAGDVARVVALFAVALLAGSALLNGFLGTFFNQTTLFGWPGWLLMTIGFALFAAFGAYVWKVRDPNVDKGGRSVVFDLKGRRPR